MSHDKRCDCDQCHAVRVHAKHEHCTDCRGCLPVDHPFDVCGDDDECVRVVENQDVAQ